MKICNRCHLPKEDDEFPKRKNIKSGLQPYCWTCKRQYDREYHHRTKPKRLARRKDTQQGLRRRNKAFVEDYLATHPCIDCGEVDVVVLEFDHRGDKEFNVADLAGSTYAVEKIAKEIAKCEVRCANCHRRKTARERKNEGVV